MRSGPLKGKLKLLSFFGKNAFITVKVGPYECVGEIMGRNIPEVGQKVKLAFNLNHMHFFDPQTEKNLVQ